MNENEMDDTFFEPADYKNGALLKELNYCWSQTINEIGNSIVYFFSITISSKLISTIAEIHIRLPENVCLAKHLNVSITPSNIKISTRSTAVILLEGDFYEKCKSSDATWTITSGNKLTVNLGTTLHYCQ